MDTGGRNQQYVRIAAWPRPDESAVEMMPEVSEGRPEGRSLELLRATALIAVLAGAVGAVALTFWAGHRNPSQVLVVLFVLWALAPFAALAWAHVVSKKWAVLTRASLYVVMLVITLGSLAVYSAFVLGRLSAKAGFVFLVVPLASWLVTATVVPIAALISGRRSRAAAEPDIARKM